MVKSTSGWLSEVLYGRKTIAKRRLWTSAFQAASSWLFTKHRRAADSISTVSAGVRLLPPSPETAKASGPKSFPSRKSLNEALSALPERTPLPRSSCRSRKSTVFMDSGKNLVPGPLSCCLDTPSSQISSAANLRRDDAWELDRTLIDDFVGDEEADLGGLGFKSLASGVLSSSRCLFGGVENCSMQPISGGGDIGYGRLCGCFVTAVSWQVVVLYVLCPAIVLRQRSISSLSMTSHVVISKLIVTELLLAAVWGHVYDRVEGVAWPTTEDRHLGHSRGINPLPFEESTARTPRLHSIVRGLSA